MKAVRLAFGMFSALWVPGRPVPASSRIARRALLVLPIVGGTVGFLAAMPALVFWRGEQTGAPLLGAVVVVGSLAALTRGLHIDGLADLVDGLGSRRPAAEALEIMRRSDIGPFGVFAVGLDAALQIAAFTTIFAATDRWLGVVAVIVVAGSGRLAAVIAGRRGVPAARSGGFGALVADSVSVPALATTVGATVGASVGIAAAAGYDDTSLGYVVLAVVVGQLAALLVGMHAVRRLGGVTGDVFGALVQVAATATALVLAGVVSWRGAL